MNSNKKIAVYPGSFDPITIGHVSIIQRASQLFDEIIVAVAFNERKAGALFTLSERCEQLELLFNKNSNIVVKTFDGLLVDFAKKEHAQVILRGIRNAQDAAYEEQMVHMNRALSGIETLLLFSTPETSFISSSLVKEVARNKGNVADFLPKEILPLLLDRIAEQS